MAIVLSCPTRWAPGGWGFQVTSRNTIASLVSLEVPLRSWRSEGATPYLLHRYAFSDRCAVDRSRWRMPWNRQQPWPQLPTSTDRQPTVRSHPDMGCVLRPVHASLNAAMTSVCAGHRLGGAPRRNRTGDPILTMEPPGTAVRNAVSPGRTRPSRPKLSVQSTCRYAFSWR